MPAVAEDDDEEGVYLGWLAFPDYFGKMIRALAKLKKVGDGNGGLLSEDYFRCVAEEFYPDHVETVVKIMMQYRMDFFLGPLVNEPERAIEAQRLVYGEFDKLGIVCVWQ
jgi:hypothetical protein